jgi:RNA polymerase sigma-70 factor (ECF subfamily)
MDSYGIHAVAFIAHSDNERSCGFQKPENQRSQIMLINYKLATGKTIEVEVSDEVGNFYLTSLEEEKSSDRRETRRHTYLSEFTYEDARFFDSGIDIDRSYADTEAVRDVMGRLTARERFLIHAVHEDGRTYTEIAKSEGKSPSTIMREANKATAKFKRLYTENA